MTTTIEVKLRSIQRLAREIEAELNSGVHKKAIVRSSTTPVVGKMTLRDHIIAMKTRGFFRSPRTASEVHTELSKTYQCLANRVSVELIRLHKLKQLRKMTKQQGDRSKVAYVA